MDIKRTYNHATFGAVGSVTLTVPDGAWTLNGVKLSDTAVGHLATFALQTLQDAYAGAKNAGEASAAFQKKLDRILEGKIGVREGGPRNPVRTRAIAIASSHVKVVKIDDVFAATLGRHESKSDDRAKAIRAVALLAMAQNGAYMHLAEKQIVEEKELGIEPEELDDEIEIETE